MSVRKQVIERYIEGFRRKDRAQILGCLSDDFVWELHGHRTVRGKLAFGAEINDDFFEGQPCLEIDRVIEEGDAVAVTGGGVVTQQGGEKVRFVFSEVFVFTADLISRLDTYHIWMRS